MKKSLAARCAPVHPYLPRILVVLFCLQPVLDILSYWQDALSLPFSMSFLPRTILLMLLFFGGFALSERKRAYVIFAGVVGVFFAGHMVACIMNHSYLSFTTDVATFIRVMQLPVTTLALITCLRCNDRCLCGIFWGIAGSLAILVVSFIVSTVTGTEPMTYPDEGVGIRGYSFWPNAQSAILSLSAPIVIAMVMRRRQKTVRDFLLCTAVCIVSLGVLYLHGTRLAYACLLMTAAGMAIVVLLSHQAPRRYAALLMAFAVLAGAALLPSISFGGGSNDAEEDDISLTPVAGNQQKQQEITEEKSKAVIRLQNLALVQLKNGIYTADSDERVQWHGGGLNALALPSPMTHTTYADEIDAWYDAPIAYCQTMDLLRPADSFYRFQSGWSVTVYQAVEALIPVYEMYHDTYAPAGSVETANAQRCLALAKDYGILPEELYDVDPQETYITRDEAAWMLCRTLDFEAFPEIYTADMPEDIADSSVKEDWEMLWRAGVSIKDPDYNTIRFKFKIQRREFYAMLGTAICPSLRAHDAGVLPPQTTPRQVVVPELTAEQKEDCELRAVYRFFMPDLMGRFGSQRVLQAYDRTLNVSTLLNERQWKMQFCYLLMEESPTLSHWFGLEVQRMFYNVSSNDVENDFHGIYFLYGYVGLALMICFLGYFLLRIVLALIRDFKGTFTLEAGAVGVALIATLAHAYFTCGVLRRANTLFYFGALLAAAYWMTRKKKNEKPLGGKEELCC